MKIDINNPNHIINSFNILQIIKNKQIVAFDLVKISSIIYIISNIIYEDIDEIIPIVGFSDTPNNNRLQLTVKDGLYLNLSS